MDRMKPGAIRIRWVAALWTAHLLCAQVVHAVDNVGQVVGDFTLRDVSNREHRLSDFADRRAVVVAFIGTECPLARLYTHRLVDLQAKWAPQGVAFLGIDSNRQDSIHELENYLRTFKVTFPVLRDLGNKVADLFAAERTPEVFVLDDQRRIRYRGRIDDQYGIDRRQINYARPEPTRRDLDQALTELLAGREISHPRTAAPGCLIGRARKPDPASPVTFSNQIVRLFQQRCQECHRPGEIAPFSLLTYEDAAGWDSMIAEVVREGRMPPWNANPAYGEFKNDPRLTDEEKELIATWVEHGAPEGDPADLPPPRRFPDPFEKRTFDRTFYIQDEPFPVPATGILEYQYFTVDPGFTEDVWIASAEAFPSDRTVVHHMAVFVKPKGDFFRLRREGKVFEIGGYVPGALGVATAAHPSSDIESRPPDGSLTRIPAGSEIVFEMHYTASGVATTDRSGIGLEFAPQPPEAGPDAQAGEPVAQAMSLQVESTDFVIPPGASDEPVEAWRTIRQDSTLHWLNAHMHLRGKSFRFVAHYPDGTTEILLDIPRYDFDWQRVYALKDPKPLPVGTRLQCLATFDNSADNLRNPDATRPVIYGHQTWDEMMAGTVGISATEPAPELPPGITPPPPTRDILAGYLKEDQVAPERRAAYYFVRAKYRQGEGDLAGALEDFGRAIEHDPNFAEAWYERGDLLRENGQYHAAAGDLNRALALKPGNARYLISRARTQTVLGSLDGALADLNLALAQNPYDHWALYYRSRVHTEHAEMAAARADLERLTTNVHPRFERGLHDLAMLLFTVDEGPPAQKILDRLFALNPELEPALCMERAQVRLRQGRIDDAASELTRLVALRPDQAAAHQMLGALRMQQRRHAAALDHYRDGVRAAPESAAAHLQLADALLLARRAPEAAAAYRSCLKLDPNSPQATNNLAWLLATTSDAAVRNPQEAAQLAAALCERTPDDPNYLDTLAAAYAATGDFDRAIATATQGVDLAMQQRNFPRAVKLQERRRLYRQRLPFVDTR